MKDTYIQSITISIPFQFVNRPAKEVYELFQTFNWGTYRQYGNTSLLMLYIKNNNYPIFYSIDYFIMILKWYGILSQELSYDFIKIYELKLRIDINIPGAIFCNTEGFNKDCFTNTYYSKDNYRYMRKIKDNYSNSEEIYESKGRQYSFLSVIQCNEGSSVVFNYSGKYKRYIALNHLLLPIDELINWLCLLGSTYIKKITNPDIFKVSIGYYPFLPESFQAILGYTNYMGGYCYE